MAGVPIGDTGHTQRFRSLVYRLMRSAWEQGLLGDLTLEEAVLASHLSVYHDMGKTMLPVELLDKREPLSRKEFEEFKAHTTMGELLMDLSIPDLRGTTTYRYACEICRHHHERWDGGGYPDGLCGNEIPPYVQVIGLADAYDALVTPRCYRPAITHREAADMILAGACGAFAPELADSFRRGIGQISSLVYQEAAKLG